jgi:hypothetical protein
MKLHRTVFRIYFRKQGESDCEKLIMAMVANTTTFESRLMEVPE